MALVDIEGIERDTVLEESKGVVEAEKQCRIALAASTLRGIDLEWNPGGRSGRRSVIRLEPGRSVVQPLSKAMAWFGPFAVPQEYVETADEGKKQRLKEFYAVEKKRALERYDYPRPASHTQGGYAPIGPHRFPNVTMTIIESDGAEHEPITLHELYRVGEWDPLKSSFGNVETPAQVEARLKAEFDSAAARYEAEAAGFRRQVAEMAGMVKGVLASNGAGK